MEADCGYCAALLAPGLEAALAYPMSDAVELRAQASVLAVLAASGLAHADGAERGFWGGGVDDADHVEVTLTANTW